MSNNTLCSVTEVQQDVEYRVEFSAGGHGMAIQVSLPPEFPLEKPVLKVSPQIDHPWVNEQCEIISAPGLMNVSGLCLCLCVICCSLIVALCDGLTVGLLCAVHRSL